jgi:molecular chaperone Hsp33
MNVPQRSPRADTEDDHVPPFQVDALDVRGRVVRRRSTKRWHHDYPALVARLVAEATTWRCCSARRSSKWALLFQSQTTGRWTYGSWDTAPDRVRLCAFDARVAEAVATTKPRPGRFWVRPSGDDHRGRH